MDKQLEKIIKEFRENNNGLRFGQWLWNQMNKSGVWESPEANALFFVDDDVLINILKK
jgi:hypothetical protein